MTDDLRPLPRLPLDTAQTEATLSDGLNVYTVEEPGESVVYISMIETKTPVKNAPVSYCELYNKAVSDLYDTVANAITNGAAPVTDRFKYDNPVPPQFPGVPT